jgi:hypothetical protein
MLGQLEGRLRAEGVKNVRPLLGELGEGALLGEGAPVGGEGGFDRAVLAMVLGEARDRAGALRELRGALRPGGVLSVTEIFGDPHHLGASTVLKEAEAAGFRLVGRFGSFPAYTLNFEKEPVPPYGPPSRALRLRAAGREKCKRGCCLGGRHGQLVPREARSPMGRIGAVALPFGFGAA